MACWNCTEPVGTAIIRRALRLGSFGRTIAMMCSQIGMVSIVCDEPATVHWYECNVAKLSDSALVRLLVRRDDR